jgi:AraC-like DNA-binding protein
VQVALGGRETCGEHYHVERAGYPFPTLEFVAEGVGQICYEEGSPITVGAGAIFAHGPGVRLKVQSLGERTWRKYFICFTGKGAAAAIGKHAAIVGRALTLTHYAELRDVFELLIREGSRQTAFTRPICDRLGELLLLKISEARQTRHRAGSRHTLARNKFLVCKRLIDAEGERFSSLEQIAQELHAEPSGLSRLFRRYQGVSPYQYLLRHKMNLAAQDLIRSRGFVKEVAARAGYADAYHFSRVFKSVHGIAPAHFSWRSTKSARD